MDNTEALLSMALIAVVCFFGGFLIGFDAGSMSWQYDCQQLGAHRADKTVYVCSVKED